MLQLHKKVDGQCDKMAVVISQTKFTAHETVNVPQ